MVRLLGHIEDRPMTRRRLRQLSLGAALLAVAPYLVLKGAWLSGSDLGMRSVAATREMHSTRMVVGNIVTVLLVAAAVVLAGALARQQARGLPAWLVLVLSAGATGLLAPIVLGLPLGMALQLASGPDSATGGASGASEALTGWVYAVAYGGFGLLGIALAVLLALHVAERWGRDLEVPPRPPRWWATLIGAIGMLPFGVAMLWWGLVGPGASGPQGMDGVAQRTVLAVTGALTLAAYGAPFAGRTMRRPQLAWAVTAVGCSTAVLQGPAQLLLAHGGEVQPAVAAVTLLATPASVAYGLAVLQTHQVSAGSARRQPVHDGA